MNNRRVIAIVLLIGFVLGVTGVYAGFVTGRSELGWTGMCLVLPAAVGSFILRRDLEREAEDEKKRRESGKSDGEDGSRQ